MPVVINEFEALAGAPANEAAAAGGENDAAAATKKIDPVELGKQLAQLRELELRIWAH
jgi:hypothetical protein